MINIIEHYNKEIFYAHFIFHALWIKIMIFEIRDISLLIAKYRNLGSGEEKNTNPEIPESRD